MSVAEYMYKVQSVSIYHKYIYIYIYIYHTNNIPIGNICKYKY